LASRKAVHVTLSNDCHVASPYMDVNYMTLCSIVSENNLSALTDTGTCLSFALDKRNNNKSTINESQIIKLK